MSKRLDDILVLASLHNGSMKFDNDEGVAYMSFEPHDFSEFCNELIKQTLSDSANILDEYIETIGYEALPMIKSDILSLNDE